MSLHYEVVFALFLRRDLPTDLLDELSWHVGASGRRPETCRGLPRLRLTLMGRGGQAA